MPYGGTLLWLEGFLGFEHRMVMFKVNDRLIAEKFSRFTWLECGPCPVFACYTLAFALQLGEGARKKKNLSQGGRKVPVGHDSVCRSGRLCG